METQREELKELISGIGNISVSDVNDEGVLALSAFRTREEELLMKKMEARRKVKAHSRRLEEEAKKLAIICEELEGLEDPMSKEVVVSACDNIDWVNSEYRSLAWSCLKKEKKYKEALEALESFSEFNQGFYEFDNENFAEPETKLLEMASAHSEKKLESEEGSELISSSSNKVANETEIENVELEDGSKMLSEHSENNLEAEQAESELISSIHEFEEVKEIENAEFEDRSKKGKSKRNVKEPFWMKDYIKNDKKGKGKSKGKK